MHFVSFEGASYQLFENETVLDALIRGGAKVSFSCRKGACHACMLRTVEGNPGEESTRRLRPQLVETGHFLPCCARPKENITIEQPRLDDLFMQATVYQKELLSDDVMRVLLEPEINFEWTPGQYLNLRTPDGTTRSYSIASLVDQDYFLEIHVKRQSDGRVSNWIHDELQPGQSIDIQAPLGSCIYRPDDREKPLLLLGTGTGLAPLIGIARDALAQNHQQSITLYHGTYLAKDLYLHDQLTQLAAQHPNFQYLPCVLNEQTNDTFHGLVTTAAFQDNRDLSQHVLYLCGNPEMVFDARYQAILAGVKRSNILADPFDSGYPIWPRDNEKLAEIQSDPELWNALEHGPRMRKILEDFYDELYEDPILNPFFHNATKERAISKQFAFLADIFGGTKHYFGLKPFNAHHWMVISDEVFDYREEMFERHLRKHGLPEHLIRRWMGFQELFRREMVKPTERGMIIEGVEHLHQGFSIETLIVASMCDGCFQEMPLGSTGRMHRRTGQLFCNLCGPKQIE